MKLELALFLGVLCALCSVTASYAQPGAQPGEAPRYTVQTVALQDYRDALAAAEALRALGFDAYVDFGMNDGRQFARVRVGCFADLESAEAMAAALEGITADAVAADASSLTPRELCVRREVGFELPQSWAVWATTPTGVAFEVEVLGHHGYVIFTGERWRLAQTEAEARALLPASGAVLASATSARFQALIAAGAPFVAVQSAADPVIIGRGQLLWQNGRAAVVLEGTAVVAYHVIAKSDGSAP